MKIFDNFLGKNRKVSDEVYIVFKVDRRATFNLLDIGEKVRLINGLDGHKEMGWNQDPMFYTVVKVDDIEKGSVFCYGVRKSCLEVEER